MIKYDFSGKCVIVTGASMGLGASIAEEFVKSGARVVLADINLEEAEKTKQVLNKYSNEVYTFKVDVSNYEEVSSLMEYTKNTLGRIDILVNNAGICECVPLVGQNINTIDKMIKVNLNGTIYGCHAVLPYMVEQKYGKIVNMSSIAAKMGGAGSAVYGSTKAAVLELTACLAREYAKENINVNCVCPGIIRTPLWEKMLDDFTNGVEENKDATFASFTSGIPTGRPQDPIDIARAVLFLSSDDSYNITAQNLGVDGGQTY